MENLSPDTENNKFIELNEELENYFRNTVIPQLFVDANLILRKFTPPAMRQFDLTLADVGKPLSEAVTKIKYPTFIENIREVIETNRDMEKEIQTRDHKWFQMNILPYVTRKDNKNNGVIITFVDISDRIEVLKQYERLNLNYENVIFALSHDLKGPIHNIQSLITLLKNLREEDKEDAQILLETLSSSAGKLMQTIEELTEIIKHNTGFAETKERVNIEDIVEDVRLGLSDKIVVSNAQIHADIQVRELNFSRKNIRSILYNLLNNAIKFSAPGRPEIWVKTERREDYVLLTVRDNGPGIERDKQEIIFSPHTRLNHEVEGTGSGLFIVKRMVEDLGGKVEVDSEPGEGSTFRVYFRL